MKVTRTRPFRRLAALRATRRRNTELLLPPAANPRLPEPLPPLEPPDDDREFLPYPHALALRFVPIPRPEPS
jgi:hypothetical protein